MGHVHHDALKQMIQKHMVKGIKVDLNHPEDFCESCLKAKASRHTSPKESKTIYTKYGEKVVADLWGPAEVESLMHNHYYSLYHDLYSNEEKVYFQQLKSQTFTNYKKYEAWVNVQRSTNIMIFGTDRGGEFTSNEFTDHLEAKGTVSHLTTHDSPSSNGVAERAN